MNSTTAMRISQAHLERSRIVREARYAQSVTTEPVVGVRQEVTITIGDVEVNFDKDSATALVKDIQAALKVLA